jgi:hypothetical protein
MSRRRHGLTGLKQGPAAVLPNSEKSVPQYIYCIQSPPGVSFDTSGSLLTH